MNLCRRVYVNIYNKQMDSWIWFAQSFDVYETLHRVMSELAKGFFFAVTHNQFVGCKTHFGGLAAGSGEEFGSARAYL
jgi:hypothetical protein